MPTSQLLYLAAPNRDEDQLVLLVTVFAHELTFGRNGHVLLFPCRVNVILDNRVSGRQGMR